VKTFEGLAIGIETNFSSCLGIAIAVVCHKWAEGLTLVKKIVKKLI
jgi:zinc transporter 1/2/3